MPLALVSKRASDAGAAKALAGLGYRTKIGTNLSHADVLVPSAHAAVAWADLEDDVGALCHALVDALGTGYAITVAVTVGAAGYAQRLDHGREVDPGRVALVPVGSVEDAVRVTCEIVQPDSMAGVGDVERSEWAAAAWTMADLGARMAAVVALLAPDADDAQARAVLSEFTLGSLGQLALAAVDPDDPSRVSEPVIREAIEASVPSGAGVDGVVRVACLIAKQLASSSEELTG